MHLDLDFDNTFTKSISLFYLKNCIDYSINE